MLDDGTRSARSLAIILIVHLAVIVLWQVLVDAFHVPKFILPSPLAAMATLSSAKYAWLSNLAVTAAEILGGFALGAVVGVTLAVLFCWSPLSSLLLLPLFVTPPANARQASTGGSRRPNRPHHPHTTLRKGQTMAKPGRLGVGIVGAGKVGAVLGAALRGAEHAVVGVSAVSDASRERAETLPARRPDPGGAGHRGARRTGAAGRPG